MNENKCTCNEFEYQEDVCPYSEELASQEELKSEDFMASILCSCCDYCRHQCMISI